MSKNHPEHIDDLENFYRDQLKDLDIEPPAEIWDNVSMRIAKPSKPFYKTSGFFAGVTVVVLTIITLLFLQGEQNAPKGIEDSTRPRDVAPKQDTQIDPVDAPTKSTTEELKENNPVIPEKTVEGRKKITSNTTSALAKDSAKTQERIPAVDDAVIAEPNSSVETQTATESKTETPSKKKSFFEKQKENYSDSTRKLFVPKK